MAQEASKTVSDRDWTWDGTPLSYDEFLRVVPEGCFLEWVDGEVIEMSPVSRQHTVIARFLIALFQHFVEHRGKGIVLFAPFQMKLGRSGREPDVMYVAEEHRDRLRRNHLAGPADLAVEIVSPESKRRDRVDKLGEYEAGGVREYWLIDPDTQDVAIRFLGDDGRYQLADLGDGVIRSRVLEGVWIRTEWLWQETPPPLLWVLKQWGLIQ
jgi:Uma2 family endonuclease